MTKPEYRSPKERPAFAQSRHGNEILMTKIRYSGSGIERVCGGKASLRGEHVGYCTFHFITRDAFHVASIRWLVRL